MSSSGGAGLGLLWGASDRAPSAGRSVLLKCCSDLRDSLPALRARGHVSSHTAALKVRRTKPRGESVVGDAPRMCLLPQCRSER